MTTLKSSPSNNTTLADEYLTQAQAMRMTGISQPTIWRWIKTGLLPAQKVGHTTLVRIEDLLSVVPRNDRRRTAKTGQMQNQVK